MTQVKDTPVAAPAGPMPAADAPPSEDSRRRDVAGMLADEYVAIHGPLPEGWDDGASSLDERLAAFYRVVHGLPAGLDRSALCLSGGGIRSAAFSFGAMRALARAGVLQRFHYLSTVSGGGYIGSWLTAWIHRHFAQEREAREAGAARRPRSARLADIAARLAGRVGGGLGGDRPSEPDQVAHVRRFTSYLSPRTGAFSLDTWTLGAIYIRNLLVNWLVILPVLVAALLVPRMVAEAASIPGWAGAPGGATLVAVLAPAAVALVFWLASVLVTVVSAPVLDVGQAERWSRWEGRCLMLATLWTAVAGLALYGPPLMEAAVAAAAAVAAGGVAGVATVVLKKLGDRRARTAGEEPGERTGAVRLATMGAAILTIALALVLLAMVGDALLGWGKARWADASTLAVAAAVAAALLGVSAVAAAVIDINDFSLHALYRNRLVRGFLRASRDDADATSDRVFDEDDDLELTRLWPPTDATGERAEAPHLFHVINATLNDLSGSRPEWNERKGVSFTFSPLHVGAHIVGRRGGDRVAGGAADQPGGYRRLPRDQEGTPDSITLGTAMSISGAAASPNMGYHSSPAVSFLLALFNVRLGWWMNAPWGEGSLTTLRRTPMAVWRAWWAEAFGGTRFGSRVLNVSDGGHFDNLGLYEMVRRRCRYIVILDGGQDARRSFAALGEAIRKVRVDFGVDITLAGFDIEGGDHAPDHAFHGTIHYSRIDRAAAAHGGTAPAPDGAIVYIRPAVSGDEPVDVQAYCRLNPDFPHQTTADQWFSESQFESYRALGEHSVRHIVDYYHASKGQLQRDDDEGSARGLPPRLFCHRVAESLALMRRHRDDASHAGGVVWQRDPDAIRFRLVRSADNRWRILPKGYVEPWEDPATAAIREVREETGHTLMPVLNLGAASYESRVGSRVTTTYFLMEEAANDGDQPYEAYRDPVWLSVAEAADQDRRPRVPDDVVNILKGALDAIPSHAGGVVYRRHGGRLQFLLVRSSDGSRRVLPKGHIHPREAAAAAAQREVAEESGFLCRAERSLGVTRFDISGDTVRAEYFLMPGGDDPAMPLAPPERERDPRWYDLEDARQDERVPRDVVRVLGKAARLMDTEGWETAAP
jgi:8-oxo-dGTP pyrophosphatase MutT (NUDIX family)